jgi:outer membrane protein, heavy metal efflux system
MKNICIVTGALLLILQGCASYHPMPLTRSTVAQKLSTPDKETIEVRARTIEHPLLRPVDFNYRDGLSPDEAAILAVIVNPVLRAVRDEKGLAAAQLFQAGILPNPQLSASLDLPTGGNTQGTVNAFGLGLGWDLSSLISKEARRNTALSHSASVDLQVAWQEWQVAQAARLHVYRLLFIRKQLALGAKMEKQLKGNLQTVQRAFSLGAKTIVELDAAKMAYQNARNTVLVLEREEVHERHGLNATLGLPPDDVVPIQRDVTTPSYRYLPSYREIVKGLDTRRLDLLALRKGYESQEARVRAAILSQFPAISIGLNHARDTGNVVTTGFAVTVNLPFFDRNQGQIAVERATRKQLFDEYVARMFEVHSEVASILADMKSTRMQMDAAQESVKISSGLVQAYGKALSEGNADVVVYNNLRDQLETRRLELLKSERDVAEMAIALEIAAGEYFPCFSGQP